MGRTKTNPLTPQDKRKSYNHQRIEHEGQVWHIDAKYDPATKVLKVYRIDGDITNQSLVNDAIDLWFNAQMLKN